MKAFFIRVIGDVQGVNFRYHTKKEAERLNIMGWAENEHDGSVLIYASGNEEEINNFIQLVKVGSPLSNVEKIEVKEVEMKELKGFEIK